MTPDPLHFQSRLDSRSATCPGAIPSPSSCAPVLSDFFFRGKISPSVYGLSMQLSYYASEMGLHIISPDIRKIMKIMSADAFTTRKSSSLFIIQMIIRGFRVAPFITSYSADAVMCAGRGDERDGDHYRNWIPLSRLVSSSTCMSHARHH